MLLQNIFSAPYFNNTFLIVSMFMLIGLIVLSTPLCVLPCKDTIEELFLGQSRLMTNQENAFCTFILVMICCVLGVAVPNIGDIMWIVGATSNPIVGFVLPVAYWLKVDKSPRYSSKRIFAIYLAVQITFASLLSLYYFID